MADPDDLLGRVQHRFALDSGGGGGESESFWRGRRSAAGGRHERNEQRAARRSERGADAGQERVSEQAGDGTETCVVCSETIRDFAFGVCLHFTCADCMHRMRALYDQRECVICKTDLPQVFVTPSPPSRDRQYESENFLLDSDTGMSFADAAVREHFRQLRGSQCPSCHATFYSQRGLRDHVRSRHEQSFCEVCLEHRRVFTVEQQLFSLQSNNKKKADAEEAATGANADGGGNRRHGRNQAPGSELREHLRSHPSCKFCRRHMFDSDALHNHLQREHFSCFLCERQARQNEYFRDYTALEQHYRSEHWVCEEPQCRGVVFTSAFDLRLHMHREHPNSVPRSERSRRLRVSLAEFQDVGSSATGGSSMHADGSRPAQGGNARAGNEAEGGGGRAASASRGRHGGSNQGGSDRVIFAPDGTQTRNAQGDESRGNEGGPSLQRMPAVPNDSGEAEERNQILMRSLREALEDVASFEGFREQSARFRRNDIDPEDYVRESVAVLGPLAARRLLPELTALLPDEAQRVALGDVVRQRFALARAEGTTEETVPFGEPSDVDGTRTEPEVSENFPALGETTAPPRAERRPVAAPRRRTNSELFPALPATRVSASGSSSALTPGSRRPPAPPPSNLPSYLASTLTTPSMTVRGGHTTSRPNATTSRESRNSAEPARARATTGLSADHFPTLPGSSSNARETNAIGGNTGDQVRGDATTTSHESGAESQYLPQQTRPNDSQDFPSLVVLSHSARPPRRETPTDPADRVGAVWSGAARRNRNAISEAPRRRVGGVIDLAEAMRRDQSPSRHSGLDVGQNGYSWERRRNEQRKQQLKESLKK